MADVKTIAESLVNLTIKEVTELVTIMKDEYGIELRPFLDLASKTPRNWLTVLLP